MAAFRACLCGSKLRSDIFWAWRSSAFLQEAEIDHMMYFYSLSTRTGTFGLLILFSQLNAQRLSSRYGPLDIDHSGQGLIGDRVAQQRVAAICKIDGQ